jgi:toxin CcdB
MARYDVYANPAGEGLLLDVQADFLDYLQTRVVIPLVPQKSAPPATRRLHPILDVGGIKYILATHLMAAVLATELRDARTNIGGYHDQIVSALDMLFQGF